MRTNRLGSIMSNTVMPRRVAQELRSEFGLDETQKVDLLLIIRSLNIRYKEMELGNGVLGACKAVGLKRLIVVDSGNTYEPRKRFTIAHEIGHLLLHQGKHSCDESMLSEHLAKVRIEVEANEFASELLLPKSFMRKVMRTRYPSINLGKQLAGMYGVSLTAAIVAQIKNTSCEAALVYHDGRTIEWSLRSDELQVEVIGGMQQSAVTENARLKKEAEEGYVAASIWFELRHPEDYICVENTMFFSKLHKFATILILERND